MSYALKLATNARKRLRALPVEVQEAVFDLLDRLAADAAGGEPGQEHRLLYRDGATVFKIFMATYTDHPARTLTVTSIWYIARL